MMYAMRDRINQLRFSEKARKAREQKKNGDFSECGYDDVLGLSMIGFGGTKPQNISVLNNEYGGKAYLLPSLPPVLEASYIRLPKANFFEDGLPFRPFPESFNALNKLLKGDYNNFIIRDARDRVIGSIVDKVIDRVWAIRSVDPGWTQRQIYSKLPAHQKIWLDGCFSDERESSDEWLIKIIQELSRWIGLSYHKRFSDQGGSIGDEAVKYIQSLIDEHKEALR